MQDIECISFANVANFDVDSRAALETLLNFGLGSDSQAMHFIEKYALFPLRRLVKIGKRGVEPQKIVDILCNHREYEAADKIAAANNLRRTFILLQISSYLRQPEIDGIDVDDLCDNEIELYYLEKTRALTNNVERYKCLLNIPSRARVGVSEILIRELEERHSCKHLIALETFIDTESAFCFKAHSGTMREAFESTGQYPPLPDDLLLFENSVFARVEEWFALNPGLGVPYLDVAALLLQRGLDCDNLAEIANFCLYWEIKHTPQLVRVLLTICGKEVGERIVNAKRRKLNKDLLH